VPQPARAAATAPGRSAPVTAPLVAAPAAAVAPEPIDAASLAHVRQAVADLRDALNRLQATIPGPTASPARTSPEVILERRRQPRTLVDDASRSS
jgi:hypothetical protein